MANKELLLVILVTLIVGISVVVAFNILREHNNESNKEAIRQEMLFGASNAQAYFTRPTALGGGGGDFSNIGYNDIGVDTLAYNGYYFILNATEASFIMSAITRDRLDTISATVTKNGLSWN